MLYEVKNSKRYIISSSIDLSIDQSVCFISDNDIQFGKVMQSLVKGEAVGNLIYAVSPEELDISFKKIQYLTPIRVREEKISSPFYAYVNRNQLIENNDIVVCVDKKGNLSKCKVISNNQKVDANVVNHLIVHVRSSESQVKGKDWCQPKGVCVGDIVHYMNHHCHTILSMGEVNTVLKEIYNGQVLYVEDIEHKLKYFKCTGTKRYLITQINVGDVLLVYDLTNKIFNRLCIKKTVNAKYYVNPEQKFDSLNELVDTVVKYNYVIKHIDRDNDVLYEGAPGLSMEVVQ